MDKLKNNLLDTLITLLLLKDFYTQLIGMGSYINRVVKFLGIFDPLPLRGHLYKNAYDIK